MKEAISSRSKGMNKDIIVGMNSGTMETDSLGGKEMGVVWV